MTLFYLQLAANAITGPLGNAAGIIQDVAMVATYGGLVGAIVAAYSGRDMGNVKTALVISAVGGLAWLLVVAFFGASGSNPGINPVN